MGPKGQSTSKTSRRSAYCKKEGRAQGGQAVPGRGSTALGAGTHLPQGHPAIGILGGGGWHWTDWQGLELNSKLSVAPRGKQGDAPCLPVPSVSPSSLAQAAVPSDVPLLPGSAPC